MEHATSLREKAIFWWENDLELMEDVFLIEKHLNEDSDYSPSNEEIETIYLKEHPTEAEVSKEEETIEDAALKYAQPVKENKEDESYVYVAGHFLAGAVWQKEQDRVLISELLEVLKFVLSEDELLVGSKSWVEKSITKAEKHLNNQ